MRPHSNSFAAFLLSICAYSLAPGFGSALIAQEDATDDQAVEQQETISPTKAISRLKSSLRDQVEELAVQYAAADDQAAKDAIVTARRELEQEIVDQVVTVTRKRDSTSRNVRDLVWFFSRTKGSGRSAAYDELIEEHLDSPDLTRLVQALGQVSKPGEQIEAWLRELIEKSPVDNVKASATFELSNYLTKLNSLLSQGDALFDTTSEYFSSRTSQQLNDEVESLLNACVEKYGKTRYARSAGAKLAQLNLAVGKIAPDIVGVDLDDVEFKLSDYRGKVVVINFWGDW